MSAEPVLSVIVPVRNVAQYLPDMLTALALNAEPGFEYIVIDDGSDDSTPKVIAHYAERMALTTIRHDEAVGLASARNAGLDVATGQYLTFLDGDDWIGPGYLRGLVEAIDRLGCDFVRVDHVQVHERDRVTHRAPEARRDVVLDPRSGIVPASRRTMVDYPYAWAGIYCQQIRDTIRFDDGLHTAEDRPWIWRLHRNTASYAVTSLAGVFYRRLVANSLTQIADDRQLHFLEAFRLVLAQVVDEPDLQSKAIRQTFAVLAHQIQTSARFNHAQRRSMRSGARALLATLPAESLVAALPPDNRRELIRPLLPRAARRLDVA